jgi:hypothetical protein
VIHPERKTASVDDASRERIFQRNTLMRVSSAFSMVVILGPSSLYLLSEMRCSRNAASTSLRGDLNSAPHNFHHALTAQTDSHRECGGPVLHYALIRSNLDIELSLYVLALMLLALIRSSTRVAQTRGSMPMAFEVSSHLSILRLRTPLMRTRATCKIIR